jgi:hypothetical protein
VLSTTRVETRRTPRHRGRPASDDQQVDLLARSELEADPEGAQHLSRRRRLELDSTWQAHQGRLAGGAGLVVPGERQAVAAREVEHAHRGVGRVRPDHLQADALDRLQRLAACDEGGEQQVAQRPVLEQQRAQRVTLDRDIPQRLSHNRRHEDGLPGEQVQLAKKPAAAVPHDLVPSRVQNRNLALADRHERVAPIAKPVEHVAGGRSPLLSHFGQRR